MARTSRLWFLALLGALGRILSWFLTLAGLTVALLLLLLAEDTFLWYVPRLIRRWSAREFPARCAEVAPGMTRGQVLAILHHQMSLAAESESVTHTEFSPRRRLVFSAAGGDGTCTVDLDPVRAEVIAARFEARSPEGEK